MRRSPKARYCLETLHFEGVCLFASYGEKFLGDAAFDPLMQYLDSRNAVVHLHPSLHPSSKSLDLPWPGFMIEYVFDTTRAAVNLLFSGALDRFPNIRIILSHAGGTLPFIAWRLSVAPMIDKRLKQKNPRGDFRRAARSSGTTTRWRRARQPYAALSRIAAPTASCSAAIGRSPTIAWWTRKSPISRTGFLPPQTSR